MTIWKTALVACILLLSHAAIADDQLRVPEGPCVPDTTTEFPGSIGSSSYTHIDLTTNSGKIFTIELNLIFGRPQQACRLAGNRVLLFGDPGGANTVAMIDFSVGRLIDTFYAYSPVLSPNRRWLVFRAFIL
jgi:hypothetical protein